MEPIHLCGTCDHLRDFSIYETNEPSQEHQVFNPDRPMFKFLERFLRNRQESYWNSGEEPNFRMNARRDATQSPRSQNNRDLPRHSSNRQPNGTTLTRILCCLRHHGSHDSFRMEEERRRSHSERSRAHEERIDEHSENVYRQSEFLETPPQSHCRNDHSKISFHREDGVPDQVPAEILYSTDTGSSSKQSSDSEFFDAREYFSNSESASNSPRHSRLTRRKSILRKCECITCTSVIRELGWPINYRIAEVCDAVDKGRTRVRMNSDVRVAKYDIRTGVTMEEWVEELDLSERVIPIGYLKNEEMRDDINVRRSRARNKLKNLFGADRRVRDEEFEEAYEDEKVDREGIYDFGSVVSFNNIDGLEPRTSKNPGRR